MNFRNTSSVVADVLFKTISFQGYFRPSVLFFTLVIAHVFAFEILAYVILRQFGIGWVPLIASLLCYTICQVRILCTDSLLSKKDRVVSIRPLVGHVT